MNRSNKPVFYIILWLSLVAIACNLSSNPNNRPPTLVPAPPGITPQPTIGYSTPVAGGEQQPDDSSAGRDTIDVELFNLISEVAADRLMSHIFALESFYTRHVNSSQTDPNRGIGAARNYLLSQFENIQARAQGNFTVWAQPVRTSFNGVDTTQYNVVGILNGTEAGAGTIIVGAHYDSRTDDLNDGDGFAPGADDNGSGVAAIIELANILSQRPMRASVIFVLFTSEEVGRQGSRQFVSDYVQASNVDVIAMLNLDTIGNHNNSLGTINASEIRLYTDDTNDNRSPARQLARNIEFIATNHPLPLRLDIKLQADRDGRYGDHFSFTERDYPAVRFIEALEDTYNREGRDTREHVDPDYLVKSTQTVLTVLAILGDGLRPPRQVVMRDANSVDENGNRQYSLIWDAVPEATGYMVALRRPGSMIYDPMFAWPTTETDPWSGFGEFEAVAVAAVDADGLIGPVSQEYIINR